MAPGRAPQPPGPAATDGVGEAPAPLASLSEEAPQVGRLLAHIEARVDGTAGEIEALEQRRLELRGQPVAEETLGELEALLARVREVRSTLAGLHVSASLGKAVIRPRLGELERALSLSSARAGEGGPA